MVVKIYEITRGFPKEEQFGLTNQIRRAVVSITSNIAEGFSRQSLKEKAQFYSMALGSLTEVQNQLLISRDIKYIDKELFNKIADKTVLINKLLNGLIKSIKLADDNKKILKSFLLPILLTTCYMLLSPSANAGTIIKSPAYLGLQRGLVGCWSFDGSYTNVPDCSGNNNTGTLTNGPTRKSGKIGQALDFDGVNDNVTGGMSGNLDNGLTVVGWIKPSGSGAIVSRGTSSTPGFWLIEVTFGNRIRLIKDGTTDLVSRTSPEFTLGDWQHFAVTWTGGTDATNDVVHYRNSTVVSKDNTVNGVSLNSDTNIDFGIGAQLNPQNYLESLIDEVRIYNRVLSATEISRLYRVGLGSTANRSLTSSSFDKGLVGYWTFDGPDISGTRAKDRSGNNNHGTLTNGPVAKAGKIGQGLQFDGSNDYVSIEDNNIFTFGNGTTDSPFSLSAWIYYRDTRDGTGFPIINKYNNNSPFDGEWSFSVDENSNFGTAGSDQLNAQVLDDSSVVRLRIESTAAISRNQWVYVAMTYNGSGVNTGLNLYMNGQLMSVDRDTEGSYVAMDNETSFVATGGVLVNSSFDDYGLGMTDDIRIYNRALSASEIRVLYNSTQSKYNASKTDSLLKGLVGYWTFDGADTHANGKTDDKSGNGNTGTLTNGPTRAAGKIGQALSFDGTNDLVNIADASSLDPATGVSVSLWAKADTWQTNRGLFSKGSNTERQYWLWPSNGTYQYTVGTGSTDVNTGVALEPAGTWHHIVLTYDNTTSRFYLNGQQRHSATPGTTFVDSTTGLDIGRIVGFDFFDGLIDEVRIYNRVLNASEVQKLYNMGR